MRDSDGAVTEDRLTELLDLWRNYMHSGRYGRGYPPRSPGYAPTRIHHWDDLVEEVEGQLARTLDTVIWGLPGIYRDSIFAVKLTSTWRHPATLQAVYVEARDRVREVLEERGVE